MNYTCTGTLAGEVGTRVSYYQVLSFIIIRSTIIIRYSPHFFTSGRRQVNGDSPCDITNHRKAYNTITS